MDNLLNDEIYNNILLVEDIPNYIENIAKLIIKYYKKTISISDEYQNIGLETVIHIVKLVLFYTNNIDCAIYYGELSIIYYLEFLAQITTDGHSFIKLTIRDAIIFVYKKTIFNINKENRKTSPSINLIISTVIQSIDTILLIITPNNYDNITKHELSKIYNFRYSDTIFSIVQMLNKNNVDTIYILKILATINKIQPDISNSVLSKMYSYNYESINVKQYVNYLLT
jgi:hypothetical protein